MTFFTPASESSLLAVWGVCEPTLKTADKLKSAVLRVFDTVEHSRLQETVCFTGELVAAFLPAHRSALLPEPQCPCL